MSLIPAFELGLWNAWIFILLIIIISILSPKIFGKRGSGEDSGLIKKEKILSIIYLSIVFASYAYTIFLPLKLGTIWFYAGLLVYLLGMFIENLAMLSFYTSSGLAIRPKTKTSKIDLIKEYIRALGVNPEEVLTREALSQPAATVITPQDREDYQLKVLSQALKEALRRELLSEKHNEDSTYSAPER